MKKLVLISLLVALLTGTTVAVFSVVAAKPTPTKKITQQKNTTTKKPNKKPTPKPTKKPTKRTLGARAILPYIPFSSYIKCVGPDGKTAYAPNKDCDNLWNYWNNHKPSSNHSTGGSNNSSNNSSNNNSSSNSSNSNNNNVTPTPTPTTQPTYTVTPTQVPYYSITGTVFLDSNNNGFRDENEVISRDVEIRIDGDSNDYMNYQYGSYVIYKPFGIYSISAKPDSGYVLTTPNNVQITLDQNKTLNFGVTLDPTITPTDIPYGYMQIEKVTVLPCTSSSCDGITTIVVEGLHFPDDAVIYLYRTDDNIGDAPRGYQDGDGRTHVVNRVGDTKIISDFQDVVCGNYYLGVYTRKYLVSAYYYNLDLKPYVCN